MQHDSDLACELNRLMTTGGVDDATRDASNVEQLSLGWRFSGRTIRRGLRPWICPWERVASLKSAPGSGLGPWICPSVADLTICTLSCRCLVFYFPRRSAVVGTAQVAPPASHWTSCALRASCVASLCTHEVLAAELELRCQVIALAHALRSCFVSGRTRACECALADALKQGASTHAPTHID